MSKPASTQLLPARERQAGGRATEKHTENKWPCRTLAEQNYNAEWKMKHNANENLLGVYIHVGINVIYATE